MLGDDLKNAGKDILGVWGAPLHGSAKDCGLAEASLGGFALTTLADQSVSDWAIRNDSGRFFRALAPVRRGGKLFSGKYVVPPVAAVYIIGVATKNRDLRDFVTGCMSSWAAQSAIRKTVYAVVGRARPDTMPNNPNDWRVPSGGSWMMHAFPAGHFANAMACATYWNERFRLGAAGPLVYAFAVSVGVGRLADRAHWASDTFLGGILGYAVGKEVARRAVARQRIEAATRTSLFMQPGIRGTLVGLNVSF